MAKTGKGTVNGAATILFPFFLTGPFLEKAAPNKLWCTECLQRSVRSHIIFQSFRNFTKPASLEVLPYSEGHSFFHNFKLPLPLNPPTPGRRGFLGEGRWSHLASRLLLLTEEDLSCTLHHMWIELFGKRRVLSSVLSSGANGGKKMLAS